MRGRFVIWGARPWDVVIGGKFYEWLYGPSGGRGRGVDRGKRCFRLAKVRAVWRAGW